MPSLKELRAQLAKARPVPKVKPASFMSRYAGMMGKNRSGEVVWIIEPPDGTDAKLFFGKHANWHVSRIAQEAPDYLQWLLKQWKKNVVDDDDEDEFHAADGSTDDDKPAPTVGFLSEELVDVIRYQMRLHAR